VSRFGNLWEFAGCDRRDAASWSCKYARYSPRPAPNGSLGERDQLTILVPGTRMVN
jgi:hypothetical protein